MASKVLVNSLLQTADLVAVVSKGRKEHGLFTEDIPVPEDRRAIFNLTTDLLSQYAVHALPDCKVEQDQSRITISIAEDFIKKVELAEKAVYIHHFNSPRLATTMGNVVNTMNMFPESDLKSPKKFFGIRKNINSYYQSCSQDALVSKYVEVIDHLAEAMTAFSETMDQQGEAILASLSQNEERLKRLQAIKEAYLVKKQESNPLHPIIGDAAEQKKKYEEPIGTGQKLKVVRTPEGEWIGVPVATQLKPGYVISCYDTIESTRYKDGIYLGLTSLGHAVKLSKEDWPQLVTFNFTIETEKFTVSGVEFNHKEAADAFVEALKQIAE